MDDRRFDTFAAKLGHRVSRRTGIGAAMAAALAGFLPVAGTAAKKKKCKRPTKKCGRKCVDLATNPKNCGRCGRICPTGQCNNGACTCRGDVPSDCPSGCACIPDAQGGGSCGRIVLSGDNCVGDFRCKRGEICRAVTLVCHLGCSNG